MFIKKTNHKSNINTIKENLSTILKFASWEPMNQIGLNHRPGAVNPWLDAAGSLYDRKKELQLASETEFTIWNSNCPDYVKNEILILSQKENFTLGRARFMRLKPKTGLSVHKDSEYRYHLVIDTNPFSYICHQHMQKTVLSEIPIQNLCYRIPCDGSWYYVDTTQTHYVYNGGDTDRIHLVVCALKK